MPMPKGRSVRTRTATIGLLALVALVAACATRADRDAAGQPAFVERLGTDTVGLETYQRTTEGFEGKLLVRSPVTRVVHYEARLADDGTVAELDAEWQTPEENPEGPEPLSFAIRIQGDSATIERRGGRNPGTNRVTVPEGVIPTLGAVPYSYAILEQALHQAAGADSFAFHLLSPGGRVSPNTVRRLAPDTVAVSAFGKPLLIHVDGTDILGRTGERTTVKITGARVSELPFESLAGDFATRDARGTGIGVASPTATVETRLGGANLQVVYSRPAKRGREIWGGLVPYGEVWRTGANAATSFSTDRDLVIGETAVPAGEYTLYSIFTPDSAQLIVNEQTGQWGTEYHPEQDLARIDLERETLSEPVERFTIAIEAAENGDGVLKLLWDRAAFSVPIEVR